MQGIPGEAEHGPIAHRLGAKAAIEADRRFVPVQNCPLESAAVALDRQPREVTEELAADAFAAPLRLDEEILEVNAVLADEGREVVKEQREAGRFAAGLRDDHLGAR